MSQDNHLDGKVIVITGAGSGFGQLVSEKAAAMGASIVASDVNQEALDAVVAGIKADGGAAVAVAADVTDRAQMQVLAEDAVAEFGAIDVMLNNAGIMPLAFYADHKNAG